MTDDTQNLMAEHLRYIRAAVDGLRDDMREINIRLNDLERHGARLLDRMNQITERIKRIESKVPRLD